MKVLCIGDLFLPSERFREALEREFSGENGAPDVREVMWAGEKAEEQHHLQQIMEVDGPEAVPVPEEIVSAVGDAEVITVHFAPVPEAVLDAGADLRAVVVARAGYENVNVEAASRRGIAVVNLLGRNAPAVAEQAIALMLAETRDVARADRGVREGRWPKEFPQTPYDLFGSTVGLIGFGQVARQLAPRIRGFEVRLLAYDPYVDGKTIESYGAEKVDDMETVFRESDFVSLHARLTDETRRFIGREHFELMKPTAYFINNARSRMVRYNDLYEVLKEGRIAGAALDVHDDEPLGEGSEWTELENVTLTPHIAGSTTSTWLNSVRMSAEAVKELSETGRATNTVNADALSGKGGGS
ncbi:Phosphoglycerate dehydrogenase and related dehydrogenase (plasmid) [Rubrobacter radiotolerans]|uniref:2-hydroxyacid dehydrogenase n=1 Tax=Rubrobacter radiotolerans TaxID=42256 RepID=A0A023X7J7_RUBRA|nr:2-hydroxyacid dehydrogenase [Rubrobacter radiotolerans]AHY48308.1 Phosphoglycerate dehydrogenase and related dehydrogenase [Rubrobacter radiotolerans]MDX5895581.1 2-hydroxyacid dehydrogenase [Rubrobacter radiotolerans]SMC01505.1 D-3-phosphoglycerate dehydrogenase [Rubrobacter radiotolerans DSM 5868]